MIARIESNGVDATGQKTLFYYNVDGQLTHSINARAEVVEYRYDALGRQTDVIAYATRLSSLTGLTGGLVVAGLTSAVAAIANSAIDSRTQSAYNVTGTVSASTDAESAVTSYSYNAFGELVGQVDPISSGVTREITRTYDRRGLLRTAILDAASGGLQLQTAIAYDAFGRAINTTDPDNKVRATTYDRAGRTLTVTDPLSGVTTYTYDGRGAVLTVQDRLNNTTTFAYTAFNRSVTMTTQEGIVTTTTNNRHGQALTITDGASRTVTFTYDKDGALKTSTDALSNQIQHTYDKAGRLSFTIDARGSKTTYTYDAANRVLTAKADDGGLNLVTTYEYDAKGQTTKVTDPTGRVVAYAFDRNGRSTTVTADPAGLAIVTKYEYDLAGRTTKVTKGFGSSAARVTQYAYDMADRLTSSAVNPTGLNLVTTFAYDKRGNVTARTDAAGAVTRFVYDDDNRLIWTIDPVGAVTKTLYDAEGRVTRTTAYATAISPATISGWLSGGITDPEVSAGVTTTASDRTANFVHDRDGRLKYAVNALGQPVEYIYDGSGKILRTIQYDGEVAPASWTVAAMTAAIASGTSHGVSGVNLATAAGTRTTRAVYDGAGRQTYSIDAAGLVTAYAYDGSGNVVKSTRYAALYTATGDPTTSAMATWVGTNANATNDRVTRTLYDGAGRVSFMVDAESYVSKVEYDAAGLVLKEIRYATAYAVTDATTTAALATAIGTLPSTAAVTEYAYDTAGRNISITNAVGVVTTMTYDAVGRLVDSTFGGVTTRRVYDAAGRMTAEKRAYNSGSNTALATYSYTYDGVGRVLVATNPRGYTTTYAYDGEGHVLTKTVQLSSGVNAITTNVYNAFGELAKVTDPRLNAGYFYYNKLGQLTRQVDPENYVTDTTYSLGGEALTIKRFYNKATTGLGSITTPPSDPTAHAKDATTTITRDKLDRVIRVTDAEQYTTPTTGTVEYAYEAYTLNAFGDRISVRNRLGGVTTNTFDKRGLLTQESVAIIADYDGAGGASPTTTTVINKFEYDARGNRTKAIEADNISADKRTTLFEYDKLDRLVKEIGDSVTVTAADLSTTSAVAPTQTITYDSRGNIRMSEDAAGARTFYYHDDLGRKVKEVNALGTMSVWVYDAAGNVTSAKVYGDAVALPASATAPEPSPVNSANFRETTYTYDYNNRLTGTTVSSLRTGAFNGTNYVTSVGSVSTSLTYDAMGNVVQETDGRGNSVFHFFDKRGKEVAKVDKENYLTSYTLDTEGNVLTEERFATRLAATVTIASDPAALRTSVTGNAADRITTFTYDRVGQRLTKARSSVASASVNGSGVMSTTTTTSTITYAYNGLGLIISKAEATGKSVAFAYDSIGREITATTSAFTDHTATSVQRRTETFYNGRNEVTQTREGKVAADGAIDRITQYAYGAGGRLTSVTDATGFVRNYAYDAAGRVVKESYSRLKSDATTVTEANAYQYDALGRVKLQATATYGGSTWTFGDKIHLLYNVFGEVTGKGITAGSASTPVYQETFAYDAAGRMWKSNSGDGSTRLYLYDAAGNVTVTIAATTTDLSGYATIEAALTGLGTSGATGETTLAGIAPTITVYDKRGMQIATREPFRELSSTSTSNLIVRSRTYNAFGEVASEVDPRNSAYVTDFSYNTMGRLVQKQAPTVNYTLENGTIVSGRPTENYFYDLSGRLVGTRDANGNLNRRTLLAHSGYDKEEALALVEYRAGGTDSVNSGVQQTAYDVLGNARKVTDELGRVELRDYDKMGRLTQLTHRARAAYSLGNATGSAISLMDAYEYDGLGQRIKHTNSLFGTAVERTDYDASGRLISYIDYAGHATGYAYVWTTSITTTGLGDFDGHTKTTTHVTGLTSSEQLDYFGRVVGRSDLGGHAYTFTFDKAGRQATQTSTEGQSLVYGYYDTGRIAWIKDITSPTINYNYTSMMTYGYDLSGNKVAEKFVVTAFQSYYDWETQTWEYTDWEEERSNFTATYDAMNRLVSVDQPFGLGLDYEYDAQGNVRRSLASYYNVSGTGGAQTQDFWYKYDTLNRFVTTKGAFTGARGSGTIERGTTGSDITYDAAGQRATVTTTIGIGNNRREDYAYTGDGYLGTVHIAEGASPGTGIRRVADERDLLGRLTSHSEYQANGTTVAHSRTATYVTNTYLVNTDLTSTLQSNGTIRVKASTYTYTQLTTSGGITAGTFLGGSATYIYTDNYHYNSGGGYDNDVDSSTTNSYVWWDDARQSGIIYKPNVGQSSTNTTGFNYDYNGHLRSAVIADGRPRTVYYDNDVSGQIYRRWEWTTSSQSGSNPLDNYYIFDGIKIGETSNNGPSELDYAAQIAARDDTPPTGAFRYGSAQNYADFDQSYDLINANSEPGSASSFPVRAGDTLESIAQALWGDASLWYLLAAENGVGRSDAIAQGMSIRVPPKVANLHNNVDTFRPYDPNKAIGDVQPSTPKPPPKAKGCGVVGAIIMVVIAVVVSVMSYGALTGTTGGILSQIGGAIGLTGATAGSAASIAAGAIAGALGSIASQAVGVATGIQEEFSWNAVALSAIGGGVGAGFGGAFEGIKSAFLQGAARGVASSVVTQGVALATGLQDRFDWVGLAVAGVAGGVGNMVSKAVQARAMDRAGEAAGSAGVEAIFDARTAAANGPMGQGGIVNSAISGAAASVAGAATRSLINGSNFGDNLVSVLPDIIGNTIGGMIVGSLSRQHSSTEALAADSQEVSAHAQVRADSTTEAGEAVNGAFYEASDRSDGSFYSEIPYAIGAPNEIVGDTFYEWPTDVLSNYSGEDSLLSFSGGEAESGLIKIGLFGSDKPRRPEYKPWQQLSDQKYEELSVYTIVETSDKKIVRYEAYPAAGRDLEAFILNFEPDFNSKYQGEWLPETVRVLESGPGSAGGGMKYTAGYVSYLADYAAELNDRLPITPAKTPPLYNRTFTKAESFTISGRGGTATAIIITPRGVDASAPRIVLQPTVGRDGPIGRSGYGSWGDFARALSDVYQNAYDRADARWRSMTPAEQAATSKRPANLRRGSFLDLFATRQARDFVRAEGLVEGPRADVRINRRLYDATGRIHVRPDVYIPPARFLADGSVSNKTLSLNGGQMSNMLSFSGANSILIVRPRSLGGSYILVGPNQGNVGARPPSAPPPRPSTNTPRRAR